MKVELSMSSSLEVENTKIGDGPIPTMSGEPVFHTKTTPVTLAVVKLYDDENNLVSVQAVQLKYSGKMVLVDRSKRVKPEFKGTKQ